MCIYLNTRTVVLIDVPLCETELRNKYQIVINGIAYSKVDTYAHKHLFNAWLYIFIISDVF